MGETCTITINLLEYLGNVVKARVMLELLQNTPYGGGGAKLMRGDDMGEVSWINRCGGTRDKRVCFLEKLLGRLELTGGWNPTVKRIPGVRNTLADGISRWPRLVLIAGDKVDELTNSMNGPKKISGGGVRVFAL